MKQIAVLIVEDSIYSADLNVRQLKKAGFIVQYQVVAGRQAMQKALEDRKWDIILSDHSMPGFDALQALKIRNLLGSTIPFVIVSEDISEQDLERAAAEGSCRYIAKEDLDQLGRYVAEIMEQSME